jgi:hypothetical protein
MRLLTAVVGCLCPPRFVAKCLLAENLKASSFAWEFTPACVDDLARDVISTAKSLAFYAGQYWRLHLDEAAQGTATGVIGLSFGYEPYSAEEITKEVASSGVPKTLRILAKHDPRYALDHLARTQFANRTLLDRQLRFSVKG